MNGVLFGPLTVTENGVLRAHLTSGWAKQAAARPPGWDGLWDDVRDILNDLHEAWEVVFALAHPGWVPPLPEGHGPNHIDRAGHATLACDGGCDPACVTCAPAAVT